MRVRLTKIDDPLALGRRVHDARLAMGMTLRDLSFPGCTAGYLSRIERGDRVPSLQLLDELARKLDVTPDYLARGTAVTEPTPEDRLAEAELALRLGEHEVAEGQYSRLIGQEVPRVVRGRALGGLAEIALSQGDTTDAIRLLEEAVPLVADDRLAGAGVVEALASAYTRLNQYDQAIAIFRGAYEAAQANEDATGQLRFGVLLANALIDSGGAPSAFELLADLHEQQKDITDPIARARLLWTQSRLHTLQHRPELAIEYAYRALQLIEATEHVAYAGRLHVLLAYLHNEQGQGERALELLDTAAQQLSSAETDVDAARRRLERARALALVGRDEEAIEEALTAAAALEGSAIGDAGRAYIVIADSFRQLERTDDALRMYELAIANLSGSPSPLLAHALRRKADLLEQLGDKDGALEALKQSLDLHAGSGGATRSQQGDETI
jgi:tetratricopeptide (TPR) repeat protein